MNGLAPLPPLAGLFSAWPTILSLSRCAIWSRAFIPSIREHGPGFPLDAFYCQQARIALARDRWGCDWPFSSFGAVIWKLLPFLTLCWTVLRVVTTLPWISSHQKDFWACAPGHRFPPPKKKQKSLEPEQADPQRRFL